MKKISLFLCFLFSTYFIHSQTKDTILLSYEKKIKELDSLYSLTHKLYKKEKDSIQINRRKINENLTKEELDSLFNVIKDKVKATR